MMSDKAVYEYLAAHGVKGSVQRMAVMRYLLEHQTHPTVDEIYSGLHDDMPTLSKTTVYNTLKLLVDQGAVIMLTIDDKNTRYDCIKMPHAHFMCLRCGRIIDVPNHSDLMTNLENIPVGFRVKQIHLSYRGFCPECAILEDARQKANQ